MEKKKMLTANLRPGMVTAESVYNYSNNLIISSNTTLTSDIIDKLKYYSIRSVKILTGGGDGADAAQPTYFEKIRETKEFKEFEVEYSACVDDFKIELNDIVVKNDRQIIDAMLSQVDRIFGKARNPLHLLDMMQCMKSYDDLTYAHSMNVALISSIIGIWLKISDEDLALLTQAGLLHDVGKLKIPPEIIKKPGKLTDEEYEIVRSHPKYGYDILVSKNLDQRIVNAAYQHHERYDGRGYPNGLLGSGIDYFASIVAVADVYDAMTSDRSYRKGMCPFDVLEQMEGEKASYEPKVLHTFVRHTAEAYVNNEVILSNGERGRVVLLNQNFLSRPIVMAEGRTYDLAKEKDVRIQTLI